MNSHLTAMARTELPAPVKWLLDNEMLYGDILDFGCGRCKELNDKYLATTPGITFVHSYDPHFEPDYPSRKFDVILCTYVLCTLPQSEENFLLWDMQQKLNGNGIGFISVRNDIPKQGWGISTKFRPVNPVAQMPDWRSLTDK